MCAESWMDQGGGNTYPSKAQQGYWYFLLTEARTNLTTDTVSFLVLLSIANTKSRRQKHRDFVFIHSLILKLCRLGSSF